MVQVSEQWARRVRILSTTFLLAGTILLVAPFVWAAYTSVSVAGRQAEALAAWERLGTPSSATPSSATPSQPKDASFFPGFTLGVPKLGLRRFVPEGATVEHLQQYGIGRISWSATPDQNGVVGIAGHRTTYGAPFLRLDRLQTGDVIHLDYQGRRYTYTVVKQVVVTPEEVDVFDTLGAPQGIALVACTPIYSAANRLVVFGQLRDISSTPASPE